MVLNQRKEIKEQELRKAYQLFHKYER
jgi:hypothetical protein